MQGNKEKIIIGTRGSKLALWQAHYTKSLLEKSGIEVELNIITTKGDITHHLSFDKLEGKGFFTKEIEDALLSKQIDLAVHSCKDMPTEYPEGLTLAAFSYRAAVEDVLIISKKSVDYIKELLVKENAVIGTSSSRRKAQILSYRPDLQIKDIRGNVPSRIQKLRNGDFDAILLAAAGLERLEIPLDDLEVLPLNPIKFVPAPAQGILAYQIREEDKERTVIQKALKILHDEKGSTIAFLERSILQAFKGGCQVPIGIYAQKSDRENFYDIWISKASTWDAMPKRFYTQESLESFNAIAITNKVNSHHPKSVFISRELEEGGYLSRILKAHQYSIIGKSLIDFKPISFTDKEFIQAEWLFFSSKVAVNFFFDTIKKIPDSIKVAAINEGTAQGLKELGIIPDFIGKGNDMNAVAEQFYQVGISNVVFPSAKNGRQTIQKLLLNKDGLVLRDLFIYDNQPQTNVASFLQDILIFTSPLNVQAYFSSNTLNINQQVISIGKTTSQALDEMKISHVTSYSPFSWSIADAVFSI